MSHPLDNPAFSALTGPQTRFARRSGNALSYPLDVTIFSALPDEPTEADWRDAAPLVGPDGTLRLAGDQTSPPEGWETVMLMDGVQMTGEEVEPVRDSEAVRLTTADVPEMLDLVKRTKPGPFLPRTIELGAYLGIRRGGELVAMAGERVHPAGWTEISAVCTDDAWRGHGFATRLIRALAAVIRDHGDIPFLHAAAVNTAAIGVYQAIGFRHRRDLIFSAFRPASTPR